MAWVKIPAENHPLFHAALPKDPRILTINMFGGVCATVNGNMFGGLFGRGVIAKLSKADQIEAMKLDGAEPFDPMGNKRVMNDTILLPESVLDDASDLRDWMRRAIDFTATLPPKKKKGAKPVATKTAAVAKPAAKKPAAKKPAAKKPAKKPAKRK